VSYNTVDDYIEALKESFVFYSAERFDVNGKNILKTNPKMYIVDLGLRRHLVSKKNYDLGFALENIVYLELRRRGYSVYVGKSGDGEVDFVAKKADRILYFQVTASMMEESTFEREMRSLRAISDNYPKIVLTLDRFTLGNYEGIEVVNAVDWLLGK
jgi:predicted AAA+ superfamily ATPase